MAVTQGYNGGGGGGFDQVIKVEIQVVLITDINLIITVVVEINKTRVTEVVVVVVNKTKVMVVMIVDVKEVDHLLEGNKYIFIINIKILFLNIFVVL